MGMYKTDKKYAEFLKRVRALQVNFILITSFQDWPIDVMEGLIEVIETIDQQFEIKKKWKSLGTLVKEEDAFVIKFLVWGSENKPLPLVFP